MILYSFIGCVAIFVVIVALMTSTIFSLREDRNKWVGRYNTTALEKVELREELEEELERRANDRAGKRIAYYIEQNDKLLADLKKSERAWHNIHPPRSIVLANVHNENMRLTRRIQKVEREKEAIIASLRAYGKQISPNDVALFDVMVSTFLLNGENGDKLKEKLGYD